MPRKQSQSLRAILKHHGITAVALASEAKVHVNTVRNYLKRNKFSQGVAEAFTRLMNDAAAARVHAGNKPRPATRIIDGLKDAIAAPSGRTGNGAAADTVGDPAPPRVMERTNPRAEYDDLARRIGDTVLQLNKLFKEAHERSDMRVFLSAEGDGNGAARPRQFNYHIYRLTHSTITMAVRLAEPMWRQVKDPSYQDVAGDPHAEFRRMEAERQQAAT